MRVPSSTASLDGHAPLHHSSTDSDSSSDSSGHGVDTMYADEDRHHQPLYSALGDVNEDPREEEEDEDEDMDGEGGNGQNEDEKPPEMKRSGTWSKLSNAFRNKRGLSDEDTDNDMGRSKTERQKKKKRKKKKAKKQKDKEESSSEEAQAAPKRKGILNRSLSELQPVHRGDDDDENQPLKH